jgi:AcrR family transcriptional regulator
MKGPAGSVMSAVPTKKHVPTKKQRQGQASRELILDATERLMGTKGYAATSISDIRNACGLPASSIYWHFGSKEGVLAAVMERGAARFFAAIPRWDDAAGAAGHKAETQLAVATALSSEHPDFLRLFYLLSLERGTDPAVGEIVRRVRDTAIERFSDAISHLLPDNVPAAKARKAVSELAAFAVALSDGVFFADHLEDDSTDVERMYRRLFQALTALIPQVLREV